MICYFRDLAMPLHVLAVYSKGERADLGMAERKRMAALVDVLVKQHRRRR